MFWGVIMVDSVSMQVKDVVKMMEIELGEGWILNEQSKVTKIHNTIEYYFPLQKISKH